MNKQIIEETGFDILIMNPPYIGEKGNKEKFHDVKGTSLKDFYQKKMDYFYFFFHQALNITKSNGFISGITTNYYVTATGATKLRNDLFVRASVAKLVNFGESKVFPSALGQHNLITFLTKPKKNTSTNVITVNKTGLIDSTNFDKIFSGIDEDTNYLNIVEDKLFDGEEKYIRIVTSGNVKGDKVINSILGKIKLKGVELGSICEVNQGLRTGSDKVSPKHISEYGISRNYDAGDGIFILTEKEIKKLELNSFEKGRIKKLYKNSDIKKYFVDSSTDLRLIDMFWPNDRELQLAKIPNLHSHLKKFKSILEGRKENANGLDKAIAKGKYYFGSVRRKLDFGLPKIVSPQRSKLNTFGYTEIEWFASADVYYITDSTAKQNLKYILGLLNSKLYFLWLSHRGKVKGSMLELYQKPLTEIPIYISGKGIQNKVVGLVDKIIGLKLENKNSISYEKQIDNLVYKLYELSYDEVKVIDPDFTLSEQEYKNIKLD
jgi:adenine-specific DNA-methyltransferase